LYFFADHNIQMASQNFDATILNGLNLLDGLNTKVSESDDALKKLAAYVVLTATGNTRTNWPRVVTDSGIASIQIAEFAVLGSPCFCGMELTEVECLSRAELLVLYHIARNTVQINDSDCTEWQPFQAHFGYRTKASTQSVFYHLSQRCELFCRHV
jgi:hypothetical protein